MWWIKERINGLRSKRCSLPQTQPAEVILPVPFKILNSSVPTVHEVTLSTCTDTTPVPSPARAPMQVTGPTARPGRPPPPRLPAPAALAGPGAAPLPAPGPAGSPLRRVACGRARLYRRRCRSPAAPGGSLVRRCRPDAGTSLVKWS